MTPNGEVGQRRTRRATRAYGRGGLAAQRKVRQLLRLGHGRGAAVLVVAGEPGSGRTTILDSAARRAAAEQFRVLRVSLRPISASRPYGAAADLLRPLVAEDLSRRRGPVLTHGLAALDRLYGGPTRRGPTPLADRVAEQARLFADARRLVRRACARGPMLLVIDDLDLSDPSSLDLLRQVVIQPAGLPLRLIAGVSSGPTADAFSSLSAIDGRPPPLVDRVELRRSSRAPEIRALAERTVDALDPAGLSVLRLLGAAGGALELSMLRAACPARTSVPGLASLRDLGLLEPQVRPAQSGPVRWPECRVRSWVLADEAYRRLTRAEQRGLHLRLLRAAVRIAPAETDVAAFHAVRAGDLLEPDERLAVLVQHALSAARCYAEASTLVAADAALAAVDAASAAARRALLPELLDLRAESLAAVGRSGEAIDSWSAAAALALGGRSTAEARRYRRLAETEWSTGRAELAKAYVDRAADALPGSPPELEHLAVQALRARIRSRLAVGDFEEVVAPLAELWRRTGWRGAEIEYKLTLESLRPDAVRPWRRAAVGRSIDGPAQPSTVRIASTSIIAADEDATTS